MSRSITDAVGAVAKLLNLSILTAITLFVFRIPMPHLPDANDGRPAPSRLAQLLNKSSFIVISPTEFEHELAMPPKVLLDRWNPFIAEASQRFGIPQAWIRAVMRRESGGRTLMDGGVPITSSVGAMGVMQVMSATYDQMRQQYGLNANPYDPHDNVIAGAAYLRWLHQKYGYPAMFAAYNDGPGNFEQHLVGKRALPSETVAYVADITAQPGCGMVRKRKNKLRSHARPARRASHRRG